MVFLWEVAWHSSMLEIDPETFALPDMADIWFALACRRQQVGVVTIRRPKNWLAAQPVSDSIYDRRRHSLICVCEDHRNQKAEPENKLIRLDLTNRSDTGNQSLNVLVAGSDFYASPSLSPDGSQLAWLSWDHPNMPWDGTELWVGRIGQDGVLENAAKVAGGTNESIFQPQWSPDGRLYFVSDRSGWWNIYRWEKNRVKPLAAMEVALEEPGIEDQPKTRAGPPLVTDHLEQCVATEGLRRRHLVELHPFCRRPRDFREPALDSTHAGHLIGVRLRA